MNKTTKQILIGGGLATLVAAVVLLAPVAAITITQPTTYSCNGGSIQGITISNTHDVTVTDCNVTTSTRNGVQITNSYNVHFQRVNVSSTYAEGSGYNLEATANGLTHDVTIEDFRLDGPMGWGVAGSYSVLNNIIVRRGVIDTVGQAGGQQKHGMYVNNWQGASLIEDVTILKPWNSGIKIVGSVSNLHINRVTIDGAGRNTTTTSGPGISLDSSTITGLEITNCSITNSKSPAIWVLAKVNGVVVQNCYFKNNYYGVMLYSGSTGWNVQNNICWNDPAYTYARPCLQFDGSLSDVPNSFFDYNNWYFGGQNPVRIGSTTYSMAAWKNLASHPDVHGTSALPATTSTPAAVTSTSTVTTTSSATMTPLPTYTRTPTYTITMAPSVTVTASSTVVATSTPTVTSSPTLTETATDTSTPTVIPTQTPIVVDCDQPCTITIK